MLPKKYRLPIQRLPAKSIKNIGSPILAVKIFNSNLSHARFGVIISKKINKTAVGRNRLKRLVFAFIQKIFPKIPPADYLIIINKKEADGKELIVELKKVFHVYV